MCDAFYIIILRICATTQGAAGSAVSAFASVASTPRATAGRQLPESASATTSATTTSPCTASATAAAWVEGVSADVQWLEVLYPVAHVFNGLLNAMRAQPAEWRQALHSDTFGYYYTAQPQQAQLQPDQPQHSPVHAQLMVST